MRLFKTIFLTSSIALLTACGGGGGSDSSPNTATNAAPPPPVFNVVTSQNEVEIVDGESASITFTFENTTNEAVVYKQPDLDVSNEAEVEILSLSYEQDVLTIDVVELDSDIEKRTFSKTLTFSAGDLVREVELTIHVNNDELTSYLNKQQKLFALRHVTGPLHEVENLTHRYMLQASILGFISKSRFIDFKFLSESQRESYVQRGLEETDGVYNTYLNYKPATDTDAEVANLSLGNALNVYSELLAEYYVESGLQELSSMDTGLPTIYQPSTSLDRETNVVSMLRTGIYGKWVESENGREFQYREEYKFLESINQIRTCEV